MEAVQCAPGGTQDVQCGAIASHVRDTGYMHGLCVWGNPWCMFSTVCWTCTFISCTHRTYTHARLQAADIEHSHAGASQNNHRSHHFRSYSSKCFSSSALLASPQRGVATARPPRREGRLASRCCADQSQGLQRRTRSPPRRRSARGLKQQKRTRRWRTPNPGSRLRTCHTDHISVAPRTPPPTVPPGGRQWPQIREMTESGRGVWFGVVRWT